MPRETVVPINKRLATSIEAEQSTLGGLLINQSLEAWETVSQIVQQNDFFESRHRLIFASMQTLARSSIPIDVITLGTALEDAGIIEQVGGWAYLGALGRDTASSANIRWHAMMVRKRSLERQRDEAIGKGDHDQAALLTAAINTFQAAQQGRSRFMDVSALCSSPPAVNWIISNYFSADSLALIFGDPGCGKSFVAIDLACHVATGRSWRGNRVRQGRVLYIAGEGRNGLSRRFKAWFEFYDEEPRNIQISVVSIQLTDVATMSALAAEIRAMNPKPDLIIIDTVNRNFGPGDENSTADMTLAVAGLDLVRTSTGSCVLSLHHSGHGEKTRSRGSSVLRAALDCEYAVIRTDRTVQITCTKSKDFDHPAPLAWTLEKQPLPWADEDGAPIDSAVLIDSAAVVNTAQARGENELLLLDIVTAKSPILSGDARRLFIERKGAAPSSAKARFFESLASLKRKSLVIEENNLLSIPS